MKILVTGSSGLLGKALKGIAAKVGEHEFVFSTREDADLQQPDQVRSLFEQVRPDAVIHAAAVVGGIRLNMEEPESLMKSNKKINENVLNAAYENGVHKCISFLSTCIFPVDAKEPWDESIVHAGEVDRRQWGYARAKRDLDLLCKKLTNDAPPGRLFTTLTPSTMYGPNDNYDLEKSHVLPAVIRKIHAATLSGKPPVFWGTGAPRREFVYAGDVARAVLWALEKYNAAETLLVTPGYDQSVKELVDAVAAEFGYKGPINWDRNKPDGRLTRKTTNEKFKNLNPDFKFTSFQDGLREMIEDYGTRYPSVRGGNVEAVNA